MNYLSNLVRSIIETFNSPAPYKPVALVLASPIRESVVSVLSKGPLNDEELREKVNEDLRKKGYFDNG